jgi:hypothetical protein
VVAILAFAVYPQPALDAGEQAVRGDTPLLARVTAAQHESTARAEVTP